MTRTADSYESEIRYWRDMALRLHQTVQAHRMNTPEQHDGGRALQKDPTGNTAASRVDRQRKRRN